MARISTGTMTVGIFAILFGLAGAYALRAALTEPPAAPPPAPRSVPVPLASVDIPAGRQITIADMVLVPMTQEDMKSRKYNLETVMLDTNQIVGRINQTDIKQGEPILTTNLYPAGQGPKLSDKLKPGMRAVTIPIDNLSAVGGSTVEGSFVDVLFRSKKQAADPVSGRPEIPSTTVTLLENVEVISVGRMGVAASRTAGELDVRNVNQGPTGMSVKGYGANYQDANVVSVTVAVSPDQANVVKAVMGQGDMSLALRGAGGLGAVTPNKYTLEGILGLKGQPIARMDRIEIYRGGHSRQAVSFSDAKMVSNEVSMIPGVPASMSFPVPDKVPANTKTDLPADDDGKAFQPTPRRYETNWGGYGWGNRGYGWGGYGGYGLGYGY